MSKIKTPSETSIEMREMVMPNHTNVHGTVFGGMVMSWIDIAGAMVYTNNSIDGLTELNIDFEAFNSGVFVIILTDRNSIKTLKVMFLHQNPMGCYVQENLQKQFQKCLKLKI